MKRTDKASPVPSGLLLYAKPSGMTSFSSLWTIKRALGTDKVGHTGTLDSFADGLLVVLSGSLTHLVPHVTGFAKTYRAVVCFGRETDTLDPCGKVTRMEPPVTGEQLREVLPRFMGPVLQEPPAYSALHVGGKRASDVVRSGGDVHLESRAVFVYALSIEDFREADADGLSYALLEVTCSKGTYIRSLARDLARSAGSSAHVCALRRTAVGPFLLSDAAGAESLPGLTIEEGIRSAARFSAMRDAASDAKKILRSKDCDTALCDDIRRRFMPFTPGLAGLCAFPSETLSASAEAQYLNGRPLSPRMFTKLSDARKEPSPKEGTSPSAADVTARLSTDRIAVFYEDGFFAGMVQKCDGKLRYGFVVRRPEKSFRVYSWDDVLSGAFPLAWSSGGTAVSVGSFDGMHAGHRALLEALSKSGEKARGIVTFTSSVRSGEPGYAGDVATLEQRLSVCRLYGLDFAVVIDFSSEFSRMEGKDFMSVLSGKLGMRFLAEGSDFRCGYKGAFALDEVRAFCGGSGLTFCLVPDVMVDGGRVSSSRIRSAVLSADFALAQRMLQAPFSYDARSLVWAKEPGDGRWFCAPLGGAQVVPPDGLYDVAVVRGGTVVRSSCSVQGNGSSMRLLCPEGFEGADGRFSADAVQFVP